MSALGIGIVVMAWLCAGGWAFRRLGPDTPASAFPGLVFACLVFAPFAAGVAIAELRRKPKP